MKILELVSNFNKSHNGVTFVNVKGYSSKSFEYSKTEDMLINIGVSYENAKKSDIETLKNATSEQMAEFLAKINDDRVTAEVLEQARQDLIASFIKPDQVRSDAQANAYTNITPNGSLKYADQTGNLNISGMLVRRSNVVVIDQETFDRVSDKKANVKSRALTIAKNSLKRGLDLRTDKWTYLSVGQSSKINVNKESLDINYSIEDK